MKILKLTDRDYQILDEIVGLMNEDPRVEEICTTDEWDSILEAIKAVVEEEE